MKKVFIFCLIAFIFTLFLGCDSPGKKAAKEGKTCIEKAIDDAYSIEDAREAVAECQRNMRDKYEEKIRSDPNFAKDIEDELKGWDKLIEDKLSKKFGNQNY